jgi:hypothetical protein
MSLVAMATADSVVAGILMVLVILLVILTFFRSEYAYIMPGAVALSILSGALMVAVSTSGALK